VTDATEKKKLPVLTSAPKSVLPEVLPDPRRARQVSAPRSRTVAHMQRLLATAAAAMATTAACAKDRGYAVVDPMPAPPRRCFDPTGTVKSKIAPSGTNRFTVTIELLPGVESISFANAEGRAHAFKSSGGDQLDVSFKLGEKSAQKLVFDVDVPQGSTTYVNISGLQCTDPYAHAMEITISAGDAGAQPVLNLSGEGYAY
jgi:hypothetical protein